MKIKELAFEIASREGKRQGISIAQINEVLAIVSDLVVECPKALHVLLGNGIKRKAKK